MTRAITTLTSTLALFCLVAVPAAAQPAQPPYPSAPRSAFQFRLGAFLPEGDSDFWDETEETFTLDAGDFDGVMVGFTYVRSITNNVELGVNFDLYQEVEGSEVRGLFGPPVVHDTELTIAPLTFDLRFIPGGRYRMRPGGRQVLKPLFYVGAGAGLVSWEYDEYGEFYDFFEDEVIYGDFYDDGVAFELHALAGVEIPVGRMTNFLLEARYSWADDDLGGDFSGLDNTELDLGGQSFFAGVSFRF